MDKTYLQFLINDMEIESKILPKIDNTITFFGKSELKRAMDSIVTKSTPNLVTVVKFLYDNKKYTKKIENNLKIINLHDKIIKKWLNWPRNLELEFFMGISYKTKLLGKLWNNDTVDIFNNPVTLVVSNTFRFSTVLIQIVFYAVMYRMMQYIGRDMTIQEYVWSLVMGYYTSAKFILSFFIPHETAIDYIARAGSLLYVCNMIYSMYETIMKCINHYAKCEEFKQEYENMTTIIKSCKNIFDYDEFKHVLEDKSTIIKINNSFKTLRKHFNNDKDLGDMIMESIHYQEFEDDLENILEYIGRVDMYVSNSKLLDKGYSSPYANIASERPYISATQIWNPILNYNTQVKNDITLGLNEHNTMVLTGPNKAGKSTFMRTLILSIYLSQCLGVTCAESLHFTPFDNIFTYLNVPDEIGKESLFEAELERCYSYYDTVKQLKENSNKKIIGFMDELFTGTNYLEGMAGSYAIIKKISENKNAITVVTTHFHEICSIPNICYSKFYANENKDNLSNSKYTFTYKIENGISDQCIALNLLKERGYGPDVIDIAVEKLENTKNTKG
jgi:DNA mismatch repair ATPase MutS